MQEYSTYDVIIRNGILYDGLGHPPVSGDLAITGDTIAATGKMSSARGKCEIDATGLAVSPGFVNMLSWANQSLIEDGHSQSDIRQGVTLEVMGEGWSMGPLTDLMKAEMVERQGHIRFDIEWTTLGEYLEYLEQRGISTNVASFMGAATARIHEMGYVDRPPTAAELERMRNLVRQAMEEGAMGLSSALIYPPGCYAETEELVALAEVAGEYGGLYISHIRNEGRQLLEALEELIETARRARIAAEVYHLKAAGQQSWSKLEDVIARIEAAQAGGLRITADMYTYPASATGLGATMPPWVQEGGHQAWIERLKDPAIRHRVKAEMSSPSNEWDSTFLACGSAENVVLVRFRSQALRHLVGKTLAEAATMRGQSPEDAAMDLVIEDDSNVGCVFFTMSEENVKRQVSLPWVSFGSDGASMAAEGVFLEVGTHPRAYGTFARLLGKYVREEGVIPLQEAIRRLTSFPAANLGLRRRGSLQVGRYADVVVFDPTIVKDMATFSSPHQYARGVNHVLVNGVQVLKDGNHTGATPGRVVRGPGWRGWKTQT